MDLELEDNCPKCGSGLILRESSAGISVGCPECKVAVIYGKSLVRKYIRGNFFNWRKLVEDLVLNYREASEKSLRLRHPCSER